MRTKTHRPPDQLLLMFAAHIYHSQSTNHLPSAHTSRLICSCLVRSHSLDLTWGSPCLILPTVPFLLNGRRHLTDYCTYHLRLCDWRIHLPFCFTLYSPASTQHLLPCPHLISFLNDSTQVKKPLVPPSRSTYHKPQSCQPTDVPSRMHCSERSAKAMANRSPAPSPRASPQT